MTLSPRSAREIAFQIHRQFIFTAPISCHAHDSEEQQYFWPSACDDLYKDVVIPPPVLGEPSFFDSLPTFIKNSMNRERWFWRFDTPEKYQNMVKGYCRMISGVDMALGRLLDELRRLDRHKDTIVILMSDNGYFLKQYAGIQSELRKICDQLIQKVSSP